ncbi:MAG: hypothetical protein AB9891_00385 [Anaerolineaceae bacterium]
MSNQRTPNIEPDKPNIYQIRIKGQLSPDWEDWFDGLTITIEEDGNTLLTGLVADQAALHGLFKKLRDLALPLISVNGNQPGRKDEPENKS